MTDQANSPPSDNKEMPDAPPAADTEHQVESAEQANTAEPDINAPDANAAREIKAQPRVVYFGDDIEIFSGKRLPKYDIAEVKAYAAVHKDADIGKCFALVCEKALLPRLKVASSYPSVINPYLLSLVKMGVVFWPEQDEQRYVFIYKDIVGDPLVSGKDPLAKGLKSDLVMDAVIKPLLGVLEDLRNKDIVHGSIRPDNMFWHQPGIQQKVVLGDCLAVPPGYASSILYQTIERGMAEAPARGEGSPADDMYAFAATIAVLLRSHDPTEGMNDEEITQYKIQNGSYVTLTGKDRFKGPVLEFLRGALNDDPDGRWTIEDAMNWLEGNRANPKQSLLYKKAARPIAFNHKKYLYPATLAMDLWDNPEEARGLVEKGDLNTWLSRALQDKVMYENIENLTESAAAAGKSGNYEERLISNLSIGLDPVAPVRFKGRNLMPDGIGRILVHDTEKQIETRELASLLEAGVVISWLTSNTNANIDISSLIQKYDACRNYMRQKKPGFGLERCIYLLAPESHCLSPALKRYLVKDSADFIRACEDMCQRNDRPPFFLDRHSIAFLSYHDSKSIDNCLYELGSEEKFEIIVGNLKCLANIQKRYNLEAFPGIARAFADMLENVYKRFHDRIIREKLEKEMKRFSADGDLTKMLNLVNNPETKKKDDKGFREAMKNYASLNDEYTQLEDRLKDKDSFGVKTGHEIAAIISSLLAGIIILGLSFLFLNGNTVF